MPLCQATTIDAIDSQKSVPVSRPSTPDQVPRVFRSHRLSRVMLRPALPSNCHAPILLDILVSQTPLNDNEFLLSIFHGHNFPFVFKIVCKYQATIRDTGQGNLM
jgi:hypothetical protein